MSIHQLKLTFYPAVRSVKYSAGRLCTSLRETADVFAIRVHTRCIPDAAAPDS